MGDVDHWQERLDALAAKFDVPGASLGLLHQGSDEILEVATGVLNLATGVGATVDSTFQIGSITKVWTTTLVMQLVDEGRLDLDAPVADVLPELRDGGQEWAGTVMMRHLLTHTSGIDGDVFADTGRGDECLERYVTLVAGMPATHPVGATFSYCNAGFSIAGRVIEVLTGEVWDHVLRTRLIEPLGLTHTSTLPEEALLGRAALGHIAAPNEPPHPAAMWGLHRSAGPAGLISSTPRELLAFARMHLDGGRAADGTQVLSAESATAMQAREVALPDVGSLVDSWGLGWMRYRWDGVDVVGHDGGTIGQQAFLRVVPERRAAVALLTNGGHASDLAAHVLREALIEIADVTMPARIRPLDDPGRVDPARYVGVYERTSERNEVIVAEDGRLMLRSTLLGELANLLDKPAQDFEMRPAGADVFVIRRPDEELWSPVKFFELDDGSPYMHAGFRATPKR